MGFIISLILTVITLCVLYVIYLIFFRKKENKAIEFRKTIRKGDAVKYHTSSGYNEGEILDIDPLGDGKYIKVTSIVPKHFIYPKL